MNSLSTSYTSQFIRWQFAWLLSIFGLAAGGAHLRAQSITNGSFENPSTATEFQGAGIGWSSGNSVFVYNNNVGAGTTSAGVQWLYVSDHNSAGQTVNGFTVGEVYHLSLQCADVTGTGDSFDVTLSGGVLFTDFITIPARVGGDSAGALPFTTYGFYFTPKSATIMIGLQDLSATPVAVDNVALTSNVPEPGPCALVTLGGVVMVCVRTSRRASFRRMNSEEDGKAKQVDRSFVTQSDPIMALW